MLTADLLKGLSPAACKLYQAMQVEPGRDLHWYAERTGFKVRWVRAKFKELVTSGAVQVPCREVEQLGSAQRHYYQTLLTWKVTEKVALRLVQTYDLAVIQEKLDYITAHGEINNRAGYLIRMLNNTVQIPAAPPAPLPDDFLQAEKQPLDLGEAA